ncbi:XrtA/PEP-CTERM system TPR-repeat protein PrsT [Sedimenticola selenatireducens]|uniref:PEP-CTERM system TPR-repeat protein PrsT n=1 Tax=Sedimenticola selenatireducens TaxID=191960 RepID=A0A557S7Y0_9GAMM|nr:XrtA/PEP-CTERM system TPR-repeat protein PrsT [Sedimenticola selenatireducens]TVO73484.1 PEP-CTERM system TPR-repeat protein PrsT [Sedimenticola selenatireducens]TVT63425.1 MAG: PEP-CTERM system TPR-repeat protein PrsT [Sedimenticola selenatireducens]
MKKLFVFFVLILCSWSPLSAAAEDIGHYYEDALKSFQGEQFSNAIIHLKNALQLDPDHLPSRLLMAEVLIGQGNGVVAEAELEFAKAHGASANRLLPLFAEAYLLQDKYQQALDIAKPASRERNLEARLGYFRGRAHLGLFQLSSAYREFDQALKLQPNLTEAKLGKAQVLLQRDQVNQAAIILDEVLSSGSASANAWLLNANIQRLRSDFSGSLTSLNRAITLVPNHLAARLARSGLLMQKGDLQGAELDVDFILAQIPREPRAKYLKSIISALKGDKKDAESRIGDVVATLKSVPPDVMRTNPSYLYLAGITSFQLGSYDVAKSYLNKYLQVVPNDLESIRTLATIELIGGKPENARGILAKVNVVYPDNPNILSLLGMAYMDMESYDLAQQYFERVVKLAPGSELGRINLARSKVASGELTEAIGLLVQVKEDGEDRVELDLLLADAYLKKKDYRNAIGIYKQLVESSPKSSRFAQQYGATLGLSGDLKGAETWFKRALELDPANTDAMIHLSRMDLVRGKGKASLDYLETKVADYPERYELMVELGNTYSILGDIKSALLWYNKAFLLKNDIHFTLDGLVDTLVKSGDSEKALIVLDEFIGRNPTDAQAFTMMGRVYQQLNQRQKAIESFTTATNFALNKGKSYMTLAKAQADADDRAGAIASLKKALVYDENYLAGYIALIKLVIEERDEVHALRLISQVRKLTPDTPAGDLLTAELYRGLGDQDRALASYEKALTLGDSRQAILGLAGIYSFKKANDRVVERLGGWLKRYPDDPEVELALAEAYTRLGAMKSAKNRYEKLLKQHPDSPRILNSAAETFYLSAMPGEAVAMARKAIAAAPKNANFLDTLGWIQSRMGDLEEALGTFREALVYDYGNPSVKYHLASTLVQLDRKAEASKLLGEIKGSSRQFEDMAEVDALLKKIGN